MLAARFPDRERASEALTALRHKLPLSAGDAAIAPLGTPGRLARGNETLLAGHFLESDSGVVKSVVHSSGGVMVADIDELWTHSARPA